MFFSVEFNSKHKGNIIRLGQLELFFNKNVIFVKGSIGGMVLYVNQIL